jgi:hypothetical protein
VTDSERTLFDLSNDLPLPADIPIEVHRDRMAEKLRPLRDQLDERIRLLAPNVTRQSRVRGFKYYGTRKLCDVTVHGDHLSQFIRGLDIKDHSATAANVIASGRPDYIHAQLRSLDDFDEIVELLRQGLQTQQDEGLLAAAP